MGLTVSRREGVMLRECVCWTLFGMVDLAKIATLLGVGLLVDTLLVICRLVLSIYCHSLLFMSVCMFVCLFLCETVAVSTTVC